MDKRIFLFLFLGMFMISTVSALDWDNKLTYENRDLKVDFQNTFLGIPTTDIGYIELKSHTGVEEIKHVSVGESVVMWYEFNFKELYSNGIGDIQFIDMRTKKEVEKNYDLVYLTTEEFDVYGDGKCLTFLKNGTGIDCQKVVIAKGSREVWKPYNSKDVPKGNIIIGVQVDVQKDDWFDVIWTIAGKEVSRHAEYTGNGEHSDNIDVITIGSSGGVINASFYALTEGVVTEIAVGSSVNDYIIADITIEQGANTLATITGHTWKYDDDPLATLTKDDYSSPIQVGRFNIVFTRTGGVATEFGLDTYGDFSGSLFNYSGQNMIGRHTSRTARPLVTFNETSSNQAPVVTTLYPANNSNFTTNSISHNATVSDDEKIVQVDFYVNGVLNQTNSSEQNDTTYNFDVDLSDGTHTLQIKATNNNTETTNGDLIYVNIDTTAPSIYAINNLTDLTTWSLPINSTWNYIVYDSNIDSCYYNTSDDATYQTVTCNNSITDLQWATEGNKTIQYCVNDTFGFETCNQKNIYIYYIQETQSDNPDPIVEGYDATFNLTVDLTNIPTTTAYLVLNNTIFWPTTTSSDANGFYFERTIEMPVGWGNTTGNVLDWYWNYTIAGVTTNESTDTTNITVYEMAIDDCSTYGTKILEFYLRDEEATTLVNGSAGSNIEIALDLMNLNNNSQTLSYNNTWTNVNNSEVCVPIGVINNTQWQINFTVGFDSTDRVWEFYYLDDGVLNSTLVFDAQTDSTIDLMDLLTADSTSFLFNYFDVDGLAVDGSMVHVYRKYIGEGVFREVERAKADQNGDTIVHLVEEDVIYYFKITKDGDLLYTSSTYTALCQATPCTIQIEASGDGATFDDDWDLVEGGAYDITSDVTTRTASLEFSSTDASTWNFTVYKYNSDGSYSSINTTSVTGTSGTETLSIPLSAGNVSFFATVHKDNSFINSEWIDFEGNPQDNFGTTLSLLIAGLIILSLGLMAVTEGGVVIVWVMLGVILSGFLGLITTELSTGVNVVVYLVLAGGLILWKLTRRRD